MKELLNHIKSESYKNFYLFYGSEKYMLNQMKRQLTKALVTPDDTMNYNYYEGNKVDVEDVLEFAKTPPFLSEHRLIVLDQTGLGKKTNDQLLEGLSECDENTVILFIESEADKRSKTYKYLAKEGHVIEFKGASESELSKWITSILQKADKTMDRQALQSFLYRTGTDMYTLKNEIDKLIAYVGDRPTITTDDLDALTSSQVTNQIFVMLEAIARKQRDKTLQLYYDLIELKESPFGILALLIRQCNQLISAKDLLSRGENNGSIAKKMKVPPFVAGKLKDQAGLFSMETLYQMVEACANTDEGIKSGRISDRVGVELLLLDFTK